jgi:nucleoside-diphosphate-sugar epimerase
LAYIAAYIIAAGCRVLSLNPPVNPQRVRTLSGSFYFDISRARTELDYRPSGEFEEKVRQTISWYEKNGLL